MRNVAANGVAVGACACAVQWNNVCIYTAYMLQGMLRQTDDGVEAGALYAEDAFLDHRAVTLQ